MMIIQIFSFKIDYFRKRVNFITEKVKEMFGRVMELLRGDDERDWKER